MVTHMANSMLDVGGRGECGICQHGWGRGRGLGGGEVTFMGLKICSALLGIMLLTLKN